jgi:hypothetical protein
MATSSEVVALPSPVQIVYMPGTDFNLFMKQLQEVNAANMELYRSYKMYAFTRMTRGLVLDFIPNGMDLFHSLAITRMRGYSLAGLSERMAQYYFRQVLTHITYMFFDMDLETDKVVAQSMVEDLVHKVVFKCARNFFDLKDQKPALHFAIYSPMDQDGSMEPSTKETIVCGWCKEKELKMKMVGTTPVAECFTCGLCFPRSIETKEVGKMPMMVSLSQLLAKHNATQAFKPKFLRPPDPWTQIDDLDIDYDKEASCIEFSVGTKRIKVDMPKPRNHIIKTKRKYSVHIKALQTSHVNPKAQEKQNNIATKRYQAFQKKFHTLPPTKKNIQAFVAHEYRKRKHTNAQVHRYEGDRVAQAFAEKRTAQYFGFCIHKMESQDVDMCKHLLDPDVIANIPVTQEIFLNFMAYLITTFTKYQSDLGDEHPFKNMDVQEVFDAKPAINGAALRLCFDQLNECKPVSCKCKNIPKEKRKRNSKGTILASHNCQDCHGRGYYMDQTRSPTRLVRILVDPEHNRHEEFQSKMDEVLPRLHLPKNLPILLSITSTRVNMEALGMVDNKVGGVFADITKPIEECMHGVPTNIIYHKKKTQPSGPRVVDNHILETVQNYLRAEDTPQWRDLSVQALVPWNDDKFPRYRVNVHATCAGSQWCIYKNDEHRSNTVYFVLVPPRRDGDVAYLYAACWSSGCKGYWRNTCQRDKKSWVVTPKDAAIIWPGISTSRFIYAPSLPDAANMANQVLFEEESESMASNEIELSFREILQLNPRHRRLMVAFEYFRLKSDQSDVQPVIMDAYRALNLIGS